MAIPERQLLDALSRTPFIDPAELARILGEPHATVHRTLVDLLAEGIVGRVSHGTTHLPSSHRYHLTARASVKLLESSASRRPRNSCGPTRVQGVADAAHPPDGRGGQRLPTRRIDVLRHRWAQVPRGVPPQRALPCHHHPPRRPQLRCRAPGDWPCGAVSGDRGTRTL